MSTWLAIHLTTPFLDGPCTIWITSTQQLASTNFFRPFLFNLSTWFVILLAWHPLLLCMGLVAILIAQMQLLASFNCIWACVSLACRLSGPLFLGGLCEDFQGPTWVPPGHKLWEDLKIILGLWPPTNTFQGPTWVPTRPQVVKRLENHLGVMTPNWHHLGSSLSGTATSGEKTWSWELSISALLGVPFLIFVESFFFLFSTPALFFWLIPFYKQC